MKKVKTEYVFNLRWKLWYVDDIKIELNEEAPEHIRVQTYQERRRTKEEFIRLYEWIIRELKSFNP